MTERLKICVKTIDGQESETYLDWAMISGLPELLLPNVQQLAWDMLPDAGEIQVFYDDDEGDRCTLTEGTAADALTFTKPGSEDAEKVLDVTVRSVNKDTAYVDLEAPFSTEAGEASGAVSITKALPKPDTEPEATATASAAEQDQRASEEEKEEPASPAVGAKVKLHAMWQPASKQTEVFEPPERLRSDGRGLKATTKAMDEDIRAESSSLTTVKLAKPVEEAAPLQHRFARSKAEDVQRCNEEVALYLKQAEEARLDAEESRMKAEKALASEAMLNEELCRREARNAELNEQFQAECTKAASATAFAAEAKEHLGTARMQIEEMNLQVAEANQRAAEAKELVQQYFQEAGEATKYAQEMEGIAQEAKQQAAASAQEAQEALQLIEGAKAAAAQTAQEHSAAERQREALLAEIELLNQQLEDVAQERQIQVEMVKDEVLEKQKQIEELSQKNSDIEVKVLAEQELHAQLTAKSAEVDEAMSTVAQLRSELQNVQVQCDDLQAQLEQKVGLCDQLQNKVDLQDELCSKLQDDLADVQLKAVLKQSQQDELCSKLQDDLADVQKKAAAKQSQQDELCSKLQDELADVKKKDVIKQSKASALVARSKALFFGVEAEEEPAARCDISARFGETLKKLSARQAFCIGRVRMAAGGIEPATGRPLAAVPASVMVTVTNNGSVEWPATTVIASVSDECLGVPVIPLGPVPRGGSKEFEMDLLVPSKPEATSAQYLWTVMDARTSASLGAVLMFEAVWQSL